MHKPIAFATLALAFVSAPAFGHHSHAMFDLDTTETIEGTVDSFDWTNPHCWLYVNAVNESGEEVLYTLELGAPAQIARRGWRPRVVNPGDAVSVTFHPMHEDPAKGSMVMIRLPDGTQIGEMD